jgi:hypothetical protein
VHGKIAGQYVTGEGSLFDVPPAAIGRFRVSHQVGAGTSGPVFRAVHPESGASLAIKLFTLDLAPDRAAAVAADLEALLGLVPQAEGLCELVDTGVHGTSPFLVTTFAPGDSLDVALKQFGPAALIDLVPRLRTLAHALDSAAARDVLHGAIHPRDVLVSESSTLMTGVGAWPILVRHGQRVPVRRPYRGPELADSAVSAAGDRFALAALAYEWTTGRRVPSAFVARDMAPLPGVDVDALGRVFATALHADPGERYPSNEAFITDLGEVEVNDTDAAIVPDLPKGNGPSRRRGRLVDQAPSSRLPLEAPGLDEPTEISRSPKPVVEPVEDEEGMAEDLPVPTSAADAAGIAEARPSPDDSFFPASPLPPIEPLPISRVSAPSGTGRLLQDTTDEDRSEKQPSRSGGGFRLVAGLLLGALVGVGAGYAVWGRTSNAAGTAIQNVDSAAAENAATPPPAPETQSPTPAAPPGTTTPGSSTPPPAPPAAPAPAEPKPAPVTASGNLLVRSTPPGATVFVDDQRRGVTPLTLQNVELGTRRVRIVRDGFTAEDRQITLTRSRPSRSVEVRLARAATPPAPRPAPAGATATQGASAARTGSLVIESRPTGASILLNGRAVGTTPMTIDDLEPGTYTVQLQLATYRPITTTVRVVAGARARAAASLVSTQEPE